MARKVLSIEIGQGSTRVVEMDYKAKNPKIYNCFTFVTPEDILDDGMVHCTAEFVSLLDAECAKWKIKTDKVLFSIESEQIISLEVKMPYIKDKEIPDKLNEKADELFDVDMEQYQIAYRVLDRRKTDDADSMTLHVVAVPKNIIDSYKDFAKMCGLKLVGLDYIGNSASVAMRGILNADETHAIIKVEENTTLVTIVSEGEIALQQMLPCGLESAIGAVVENEVFGEKLTYDQAVSVLCQNMCIRRTLDDTEMIEEEDVDDAVKAARIDVTQSLQEVVAMVSGVIEAYIESEIETKIDNIYLIGLGGDIAGLSRLMSNEFQYKVQVFRGMEGSTVNTTVRDERFSMSSFISCVGAAIEPMDFAIQGKKRRFLYQLLKKDENEKINPAVAGIIVLAVCLAIAIGLLIYTIVGYFYTKTQLERTQVRVEELQATGAQEVYYEYLTLEELAAELDVIYESTLSRNEELVDFIEELEEKMPSSITVMNFNANAEGVSMGMSVSTKEEAANVLLQLKSFESIEVVSTSGLTESTEENGQSVVSFSVSLTYKPVDPDEMMRKDKDADKNADDSMDEETDDFAEETVDEKQMDEDLEEPTDETDAPSGDGTDEEDINGAPTVATGNVATAGVE